MVLAEMKVKDAYDRLRTAEDRLRKAKESQEQAEKALASKDARIKELERQLERAKNTGL